MDPSSIIMTSCTPDAESRHGDFSCSTAEQLDRAFHLTEDEREALASNRLQAAKQLGLHRSNLYRKMRQLGMAVPE